MQIEHKLLCLITTQTQVYLCVCIYYKTNRRRLQGNMMTGFLDQAVDSGEG